MFKKYLMFNVFILNVFSKIEVKRLYYSPKLVFKKNHFQWLIGVLWNLVKNSSLEVDRYLLVFFLKN